MLGRRKPRPDRARPLSDDGGDPSDRSSDGGQVAIGSGNTPDPADSPLQQLARQRRPGLSLKGRALKYLAQREHSRLELQRKLAPHAEQPDQIESVLDELASLGLFSEQRFADSLVRQRASRFGVRRIEHELDQHRLRDADTVAALSELRNTERDRALAIWRKRFHGPPADLAARAKQHRFLAQRGFGGETIAWVLRQAGDRGDPLDD